MMAYFNNLILLILWMIMIGTSNTGESKNNFQECTKHTKCQFKYATIDNRAVNASIFSFLSNS